MFPELALISDSIQSYYSCFIDWNILFDLFHSNTEVSTVFMITEDLDANLHLKVSFVILITLKFAFSITELKPTKNNILQLL